MRKNTFTKVLSIVIAVGMLISFVPTSVFAESTVLQEAVVQETVPNAEVKLSGVVKDGGMLEGAKHGYPLYAKITLTGPDGAEIFYSDPFTGAYEAMIETDVEYTLKVEAFLYGYTPYFETFTATGAVVKNIDLNIAATCTAPGYQPQYEHFWNFEANAGGFTFGGENSSWAWGDFTSGPGHAISGTKGIATNPAGDYNINELSWAMSPVVDLSGVGTGQTAFIEWWAWLFTESATYTWDVASVEFTTNGTTWTTVWGPSPRQDTAYHKEQLVIDPAYYVANFQFRFWFKSDLSGVRAGWYVDDIGLGWIPFDSSVTPVTTFHFDGAEGEEEWTTGSTGTGINTWAKGVPTTGPGVAHSTPNVWATNLDGNYNNSEVSFITSPTIDLSDHVGKEIVVSYFDWLITESATSRWDEGSIHASADGGATFVNIIESIKRIDDAGAPFKPQTYHIPAEFATENFQVRFQFKSDSVGQRLGWYVDDISIGVKQPLSVPCGPVAGGSIVAGYVYDLNEEDVDVIIMDALVETPDANDTTKLRPNDEEHDGLYYFFQPLTGPTQEVVFTVSKDRHGTINDPRMLTAGIVNRQDFRIGSGWVVPNKTGFERSIYLGDDDEFDTLYLHNRGAAYANWELNEVNIGFQPLDEPIAPQILNIPAYDGPVVAKATPEIGSKPNAIQAEPGAKLTLNGNAAKYGINAVVPAFGAHLYPDPQNYVKFPDVAVPGTWQVVAPVAGTIYAGDYLGSDFSKIYVVDNVTKEFKTISTTDGTSQVLATITTPAGTVAGITGAKGFFYGITSTCGTNTILFKLNLDGTTETLGTIAGATCGIDLAYVPAENMIYIVDIQEDVLYKVDPANPAGAVKVGTGLGYLASYAQGMDYDEANGILYWAACSDNDFAELRIVDTVTGASVKVGDFPSGEIDAFSIAASSGGGVGGAIPWLDENPVEGYIEAGDTMAVQLQWSVKDIDQPGDYYGELVITTDTPKEIAPIPVTLHVWRPFTWGNIKGTVTGMEQCDLNPALMPEATINFYRDGELVKSTMTDESGYFSYALEAATYDIEAVVDGYVTARMDGVVLGFSEDVNVDLTLRHDSACLTYEPEMLFAQLYPDQTTDLTLTFRNTGAQDAVFEIFEVPGEGPVPYAMAGVELVLDDGSYDDAIGIGGNSQFLVVNRFTPEADLFPFTINEVQIYFETTVQAGDPFEIYLYQNETSQDNPAPGSEFLYKQAATVPAQNSWAVITLEEPVTFEGPGDVLIGAGFLKKPGAAYFPASIDETATQSRSWAGWYTGDIPSTPTLPPDDTWTKIDAAGIAGNWMIRGYGESGGGTPGDIPWLELDPTAGVVVADTGELEVIATFDSAGLTWGDYFGQLRVDNAPDPRINIPVQLRILPFNMMYLPMISIYFPPPLQ